MSTLLPVSILALAAATTTDAAAQTITPAATLPSQSTVPAGGSSDEAGAEITQSSSLEDIVVTAQRRSERLQNVPIAVTAVTQTRLAAIGVATTQDLSIVTPGLTAPQTAGFAQPHIRGVGSSTNGPGIEAPVATYIDGVYLGAAPASLLTLNNIDRIEVLKGPQGTLFGRNATGGLIQVVTKDPKQTPGAAINLSYANYRSISADAYVTGGIADGLAADLAVRYEHQGEAWGRNLGTGNPIGQLDHDFAARVKFLWEPETNTQVRLALDYEDRISSRDVQHLSRQYPGTYNSPLFGGPYPQGGFYDVNNDRDLENSLRSGGASLQINHDLGAVAMQSITAYRGSDFHFPLDLDLTSANILSLDARARSRQISQEFQLSSTGTGSLRWVAGLYYFNASDRYAPLNISFGPAFISPVPGVAVNVIDDNRQKTASYAGYAQASYELLPRLTLTGGLRYTSEKKRVSGTETFAAGGTPIATTPFPPPAAGIPSSLTFRKLNYRMAIDYKLTPTILLYASYNTGFKSGGYNLAVASNPPYAPENIKAAEAGIKSELFDRRLRLNMSGFHYDYENLQVGRYIAGTVAIYNGAKAELYGGDVDAELVVNRALSLTGGASLLSAKFKSFPLADYVVPVNGCTPPLGGVCSASAAGNRLPFSPKFTFNVGGDYHLDTAIGSFALNGTYYRTSSFFAAPDNVGTQRAYDLVNLSLTWTDVDKRVSVKGWAKNIGGTRYVTSLVEANQGLFYGAGDPRTYGVTLGHRF